MTPPNNSFYQGYQWLDTDPLGTLLSSSYLTSWQHVAQHHHSLLLEVYVASAGNVPFCISWFNSRWAASLGADPSVQVAAGTEWATQSCLRKNSSISNPCLQFRRSFLWSLGTTSPYLPVTSSRWQSHDLPLTLIFSLSRGWPATFR